MELLNEDIMVLPDACFTKATSVLRALDHDVRRKILALIEKKGSVTVTEIYVLMQLPQPMASQHLNILRNAGFVTTRRSGKFIYYKVNQLKIDQVKRLAQSLLRLEKELA